MREQIRARGVAVAIVVLCLSGCNQASRDYRVPAANVPLNEPLTGTLRRGGDTLPPQVKSINCYVPGKYSVSCDVELTDQGGREMGGRTFEWRYEGDVVSFAGNTTDAGPIRNVDLDAMADSHFQFVVSRDIHDGRAVAYASVDRSRVPFRVASTLISDVLAGIADTAGAVMDAAHAQSAAAIRETWSAAASAAGVSGPGAN